MAFVQLLNDLDVVQAAKHDNIVKFFGFDFHKVMLGRLPGLCRLAHTCACMHGNRVRSESCWSVR